MGLRTGQVRASRVLHRKSSVGMRLKLSILGTQQGDGELEAFITAAEMSWRCCSGESNKRPLLTESFIHAQFNTHHVLCLKSALEIKISVGLVLFSPRGVPRSTFSSVIDSGWKDLLSSQQKKQSKTGNMLEFLYWGHCHNRSGKISFPIYWVLGASNDRRGIWWHWGPFEATEDYKNVIWQVCLAVRGELLNFSHN